MRLWHPYLWFWLRVCQLSSPELAPLTFVGHVARSSDIAPQWLIYYRKTNHKAFRVASKDVVAYVDPQVPPLWPSFTQ